MHMHVVSLMTLSVGWRHLSVGVIRPKVPLQTLIWSVGVKATANLSQMVPQTFDSIHIRWSKRSDGTLTLFDLVLGQNISILWGQGQSIKGSISAYSTCSQTSQDSPSTELTLQRCCWLWRNESISRATIPSRIPYPDYAWTSTPSHAMCSARLPVSLEYPYYHYWRKFRGFRKSDVFRSHFDIPIALSLCSRVSRGIFFMFFFSSCDMTGPVHRIYSEILHVHFVITADNMFSHLCP